MYRHIKTVEFWFLLAVRGIICFAPAYVLSEIWEPLCYITILILAAASYFKVQELPVAVVWLASYVLIIFNIVEIRTPLYYISLVLYFGFDLLPTVIRIITKRKTPSTLHAMRLMNAKPENVREIAKESKFSVLASIILLLPFVCTASPSHLIAEHVEAPTLFEQLRQSYVVLYIIVGLVTLAWLIVSMIILSKYISAKEQLMAQTFRANKQEARLKEQEAEMAELKKKIYELKRAYYFSTTGIHLRD